MLFWELLNLDARLVRTTSFFAPPLSPSKALSLGRPPSICLDHVDCRRPSYVAPEMYIVPGAHSCQRVPIWSCNVLTCPTDHDWKHGFFLHCLTPVLTTVISAQPQPYKNILDVDRTIRDFTVPDTLDIFNPNGLHDNRQLTMQQVLVSSGREIGVFVPSHVACRRDAPQFFSSCTATPSPRPSTTMTHSPISTSLLRLPSPPISPRPVLSPP